MVSVNRVERLKVQVTAVELLRALKKFCKYRELEELLGIPASLLAKYVKGSIVPSYERALKLMKLIAEESLERKILNKVLVKDEYGFINIRDALGDPYIIRLLTYRFMIEEAEFNKVLSIDIDSMPLSSMISALTNTTLVTVTKTKEIGLGNYAEETYYTDSPPFVMTLYVPKGAIQKGDRLLVVCNVLRTGRTLEALIRLVERMGGSITKILVVASIGDEWTKRLKNVHDKITVLVKF